jgi:hypothetical protein
MSQYKTGTVGVIGANQAVTGVGTAWLANVAQGQTFMLNGSSVPYVVGSVNSDTSITLTSNFAGATQSGLSYEINTSRTPVFGIDYMEQKDIDTATTFKRAMLQIEALLTGGVAYPTLTASAPYNIAQTWNNAGVTFDALTVNITDSASNAASRLINLLVGGVSKFSVTKAGNALLAGTLGVTGTSELAAVNASGQISTTGGISSDIASSIAISMSSTTNGRVWVHGPNVSTNASFDMQSVRSDGSNSLSLLSISSSGVVTNSTGGFSFTGANYGLTITPSTGTAQGAMRVINTGGTAYFGVDNSAGSAFSSGAYSAVVYTPNGFSIVVNGGNVGLSISKSSTPAVTLPGHVAGTPTWVASDKYLVVDSSGHIHVSAVGPAS